MNNLLWILAGNTLYALGVALFILPAGLITGGTTGLALFFRFQFHIPISGFVLIINVAMFLTGLAVLGKRFALTTLVSTFYYPIILGIIQRLAGSDVYKRQDRDIMLFRTAPKQNCDFHFIHVPGSFQNSNNFLLYFSRYQPTPAPCSRPYAA